MGVRVLQGLDSVMPKKGLSVIRSHLQNTEDGLPSPVRLSLLVTFQTCLGVKPLGALDAVVSAAAGQVLNGLGLLVLSKMPRGSEVGLDLVQIPMQFVSKNCSVKRGGHI